MLDPTSWNLLTSLFRTLDRNAFFIFALRSNHDNIESKIMCQRLSSLNSSTNILLGNFSEADTTELVRKILHINHVPVQLAEAVYTSSHGHPLFAKEMVLHFIHQSKISVKAGRCTVSTDLLSSQLPESLHAAIMSRLDRLSSSEQITLKVASAIGDKFQFTLLAEIHPSGASKAQICQDISALVKAGLIELASNRMGAENHLSHLEESVSGRYSTDRNSINSTRSSMEAILDMTFAFRSTLSRQVAYDGLTFSIRKSLHRKIADWLSYHEEGKSGVMKRIAEHWCEAGEPGKAVQCFSKACQECFEAKDYVSMLKLAETAVDLNESEDDVDANKSNNGVTSAHTRCLFFLGLAQVMTQGLSADTVNGEENIMADNHGVLGILNLDRAFNSINPDYRLFPPTSCAHYAQLGSQFTSIWWNGHDLEEQVMERHASRPRDGTEDATISESDSAFISTILKSTPDLSFNMYIVKGLPRHQFVLVSFACFCYQLALDFGDPELTTMVLCGIGKMYAVAGFVKWADNTLKICEKRAERLMRPGLDMHVTNFKCILGLATNPLQGVKAGVECIALAIQLGDRTVVDQMIPTLLQLYHITCNTRERYRLSRESHAESQHTNNLVELSRVTAYYSFDLIMLNNPGKSLSAIDEFLRFDNGKARVAG